MPVGAIRERLRLIRYYSATRPYNRWSRALDASIIAAILLALPVTWALDRTRASSSQTEQLTGKLFQEPDGRVWGLAGSAAANPKTVNEARGDAAFHGAFRIDVHNVVHGWPFTSSHRRPVGYVNVELFGSQQSLIKQDLAEGTPERLAIDAALRKAGMEDVVEALWPGGEQVARSQRPAGWLANAILLTLVMMTIAWMAISALRLGWSVVGAARRARRGGGRRSGHRCPDCGYDLRASTFSERCPECGALLGV